MTSLERHDNEIKLTINRIQKAVEQCAWRCVSDLTKYLLRIVKERQDYCRYKKISSTIQESKITRI